MLPAGICALALSCSSSQDLNSRITTEEFLEVRRAQNYTSSVQEALLHIIKSEQPEVLAIGDYQFPVVNLGQRESEKSSSFQLFKALPALAREGYCDLVTDWVNAEKAEFENFSQTGLNQRSTPVLFNAYRNANIDRQVDLLQLYAIGAVVNIHYACSDQDIVQIVNRLRNEGRKIITYYGINGNNVENTHSYGNELAQSYKYLECKRSSC